RLVLEHVSAVRQQALEALAQALLGRRAEREVEQLGLLQRTQAIVDAAVDVDDVGVFLEQGDGREETRALQTILVQTVRHDVGGSHQRYAILEQLFEQRGENHRI